MAALVNITVPLAALSGDPAPSGEVSGFGMLDTQDTRALLKTATVLYAAVWVYAVFFPKGADGPSMFVMLTFVGGFLYLIISAICVGQMVALRREQRPGGQSPRRPAAGADGQASQRLPSSDPGGELPPADGGQQHTAEAARSRLPRPQSSGSQPGRPCSPECGARTPRSTRPVPGPPQPVAFALV